MVNGWKVGQMKLKNNGRKELQLVCINFVNIWAYKNGNINSPNSLFTEDHLNYVEREAKRRRSDHMHNAMEGKHLEERELERQD
jgi:hypothetical protein